MASGLTVLVNLVKAMLHKWQLLKAAENCTKAEPAHPADVDAEVQGNCDRASQALLDLGAQVKEVFTRDANNILRGGEVLVLTDQQAASRQW